MKVHARKKAFRLACKQKARDGKMNNAEGQWINRSQGSDNSMKRDYWPQSGKGK